MLEELTIGVDMGGTNLRMAVVNAKGVIIEQTSTLTNAKRGYQAIFNELVSILLQFIAKYKNAIVAVGVAIAGQVEKETGFLHFAPNLSWENIPLKADLEKLIKLPIFIINDVKAATLGEWKFGAGRGAHNITCLFIGTGIGGGIIINDQLVEGYSNSAGELGHMIIDPQGPSCNCGSQGCLEAIGSGLAIAKKADRPSAKDVVMNYQNNDEKSKKIIERAINAWVIACINITNILNPEKIILGGGVFLGLPEALGIIQEAVLKKALPSATNTLDILPSLLGDKAGLIGSSYFARTKLT